MGGEKMMTEKISTKKVRSINRNRVFRLIYSSEFPLTKQDIAYRLNMSLPTVSQNLNELFEKGLLNYVGTDDSTGGRRARLISSSPNAKFSVGIELSPKHISYIAINLKTEELAFSRIAYQFSNSNEYRLFFANHLEKFLDENNLSRENLLGVGITLPGIINSDTKTIEIAPVLHLRQIKIKDFLPELPYPMFLQNDASAGCFAEWWNNQIPSALAYLFIGKGVGGALVINSKSYEGENHRSAEFGHMCIVPDGELCSCGRRGCLEAYCSIDALGEDTDIFFDKLSKNDPIAKHKWDNYCRHLSIGIHNIRTCFGCDIVIGGSISSYLEKYLDDIKSRLKLLTPFDEDLNYIKIGKCSNKSNAIGVALHFIAKYLENI